MKTALLFGANGYIGRHVAKELTAQAFDFISIGLSPESIDGYLNYKCIDITDDNALKELSFDVDCVFMFAGLIGEVKTESNIEKFNAVNEKGLQNILQRIKGTKAKIIFPSSRLVYKGIKNQMLLENSEKEAKSHYAKNKLIAEKMIIDSSTDYTIYRVCVPYGSAFKNIKLTGTIGFMLNQMERFNTITLFGDGGLKRTFTHINDIAEIIVNTAQSDKSINKTYNIGGLDNSSLLDLAQMFCKRFEGNIKFEDWSDENIKTESGDTIFNDSKLKTDFGVVYKNTLQNWISSL